MKQGGSPEGWTHLGLAGDHSTAVLWRSQKPQGQNLSSSQTKAKRRHLPGPLPESSAAQLSDPWAPGASAAACLMDSLPDVFCYVPGILLCMGTHVYAEKELLASLGMDKQRDTDKNK